MRILILIPAYNEQNSIASVIRGVRRARPDADIVVINDGSTDATSLEARATEMAHVIDMPVNVGIGGAMQTGYLYAARHGYEIAIQMDGDGQHDPAELNKIIEPVAKGWTDCCIGSRFLQKTAYRSSVFRRSGILFFSWMIRGIVRHKATDPTSGFRAVNRDVIQLFASYYPYDYPEVEAIVLLVRKKFRIQEASVLMHQRQAGKSSITPVKSLYYMLKVSLAVMMTRLREVR